MVGEMSTTSVALLLLPYSSAHFCTNGSSRKAKISMLKRELCKDAPPPPCVQLLILMHKTSTSQEASGHAFKSFPGQPSSLYIVKVSPLLLTVDSEQHAGIAHPHHILGNAGKQEPVVLAGDIHQGQIDGMNIGPVEVGLKSQREIQTEISVWCLLSSPLLWPEDEDHTFHIRCEKVSKIQGQLGPGCREVFPRLIK